MSSQVYDIQSNHVASTPLVIQPLPNVLSAAHRSISKSRNSFESIVYEIPLNNASNHA